MEHLLSQSATGRWAAALMAAAAVAAAACQPAPDKSELQTTVDYHFETEPTDRNSEAEFLEDLEGAERRIRAALAGDALTGEVADRLVSAQDRGLEVEVVADRDDRTKAPVQTLLDNDVPVTFGDGQLTYLPNPNLSQILSACAEEPNRRRVVCGEGITGNDPCGGQAGTSRNVMCRPGSYNIMSHRFVLIDEDVVWNFAGGLSSSGSPLAWRAESEILHEDFNREFRQLSGGTFSTTLDAYNGPLKSTTNMNVDYMTNRGQVQVRFNPQERLLKHVIDEVYRARDSVAIVTPVLRNPFLLDALEYKANNGFDVDVVVGPGQPQGSARNRLRNLGASQVSGGRPLPTLVVVDGKEYRNAGQGERQWARTAVLVSHPLIYSQPYTVPNNANETFVYPSDHFADGTMWKFYEYDSNRGGRPNHAGPIDRLEQYVQQTLSRAGSL